MAAIHGGWRLVTSFAATGNHEEGGCVRVLGVCSGVLAVFGVRGVVYM